LIDGWSGTDVYDYRIMSADRASGATRVLIERASGPSAVGGDILVFHRGASLFAVPFDFANLRALGEERMVVSGIATDRWGGSAQFAVSANGTLVYAPGKRRGEGRRLVWSKPDGSVEAITPGVDAFSDGVALSADGSRMLVRTIRAREELWTVDLVGGGMQPVIAGELFGAALAPAGDSVIYCINLGKSREVRRAPLAGGEHTVLWKGQLTPWCVSGDGKQILVGSEVTDAKSTKSDILLLDLRREPPELVPVIATPASEAHAQWSPDENWLAYRSDSSGSGEIYVRAWPGGTRDWKVSRDGGAVPRWSTDSRTLFYLDDLRLMAVDLQTSGTGGEATLTLSAPREVLSDLVFAEAGHYAIGPDGRVARIELAEWERAESHLEVVVGWLPELRRILSKP
jgi:hypothetical protein